MKWHYVYMLLCADETIYVGITDNIIQRVAAHQAGVDPEAFTFSRRPLELIYYETFTLVQPAIEREKQLKGWRRAKKWALANGDIERLTGLSQSNISCHPELVEGWSSTWRSPALAGRKAKGNHPSTSSG